MDDLLVARAVAAVESAAVTLDLPTENVAILHNSTKVALRLLPCDVFARVAPIGQAPQLALEIELAQEFVDAGAPAVALDPRVEPDVYELDGFAVTWWTFHDTPAQGQLSPRRYADALERLHAVMRRIDVATPHFLDRVGQAQQLVTNQELTPGLDDAGRELLLDTFDACRAALGRSRAADQLLHGEPHPGNVLNTAIGPLFIDLETGCRGPVEFDVAHVPTGVSRHYADLDQELLDECRKLVLAMVAAWRWDAGDEFPDRLRHGHAMLELLRQGPPWPSIGDLGSE